MSEQDALVQLEGLVHAHGYEPGAPGKQFLGAALECVDGTVWVLNYDEQSPFHAFAGRHVVVAGRPYSPTGQHLIGWSQGKTLRHLRPSSLRVAQGTGELGLVEVGTGTHLRGRFDGGDRESALRFVTADGVFSVVNDPAGLSVGPDVEVWAYPVQLSPSSQERVAPALWVVCPCSAADLWKWRGRS